MNKELVKKMIIDFLGKHKLCVISTIHESSLSPESAVVAFTEKENLQIIFGTSNTSRKYKNLKKNNSISLVIGWDSNVGTIQYEGIAEEIPAEDSSEHAEIHINKNPGSQRFSTKEDQRYFLISPKWIRLMNNSGDSPGVYELTF